MQNVACLQTNQTAICGKNVCSLTSGILMQDVKAAPVVVEEKVVPEPVQQPKREPKELPKVEDEVH